MDNHRGSRQCRCLSVSVSVSVFVYTKEDYVYRSLICFLCRLGRFFCAYCCGIPCRSSATELLPSCKVQYRHERKATAGDNDACLCRYGKNLVFLQDSVMALSCWEKQSGGIPQTRVVPVPSGILHGQQSIRRRSHVSHARAAIAHLKTGNTISRSHARASTHARGNVYFLPRLSVQVPPQFPNFSQNYSVSSSRRFQILANDCMYTCADDCLLHILV